MDVLWTIVGFVVLFGVALLFVVDALQHRTVAARIAALLVLAAGVMFGAELWTPWGPIAVLVVAFCVAVVGRVGDQTYMYQSRSRVKPRRRGGTDPVSLRGERE